MPRSPKKGTTSRTRTQGSSRKSTRKSTQPSKRARNKAAIRARIVRAALELFDRQGFHETTTKAIAQRARVAEGTIFNYFATKEDIALHFFELEVDHAMEAVRANTRLRRAPLEEKLFVLVQSQIEYLAPYERFIGAAFIQALRPSSALVLSQRSWDLRARYVGFVQELIAESIPGAERSLVTWLAPQAFWVFYIALLLYWLNDTSPGKQSTLSLLDRSLRLGVHLLEQDAGTGVGASGARRGAGKARRAR
jgi:AcrR family transcriptional regulator